MDLTSLSLAELRKLDEQIVRQLALRETRQRAAAIEEIYAVAHRLGLPLQSILDAEPAAKPRRQTQRYRDPTNPANQWSGAGPRPAWFKRALAAGVPLASLTA